MTSRAAKGRLAAIGFWFHDEAPDALPLPNLLIGRWRARERDAVLTHLRAGAELVRYPTGSWCRFRCGTRAMGCTDVTDGVHVWPAGLAHYVARHGVRLPEWFVAHAQRGERAPVPRTRFGLYDFAPWRAWAKEQGACLDLRGFHVPTAAEREAITDELGRVRGRLVLCDPTTREAVLRVRDGSLDVHTLREGARTLSNLPGFHAWPRA